MNEVLLEISLLFILLIEIFRNNLVTNIFVMILSLGLLVLFVIFSFFKIDKIRIFLLMFLGSFLFTFIILNLVFDRIETKNDKVVHDGVVMTEEAFRIFGHRNNPYLFSFRDVLKGKYGELLPKYIVSYPYSPGMFLVNVPIFTITEKLFGFVDMRFNLLVFFLASALIAMKLVKNKVLFLIIFLFNPLFIPMLIYGANEVIILFFFFLLMFFVKIKTLWLATIMLGLAAGSKILIIPLVPLYFIYIFFLTKSKQPNRWKVLINQFLIFITVTITIYAPFIFLGGNKFWSNILFPWIGAGDKTHPIAGFLGVSQILTRFDIISIGSSFPFFILALLFLGLLYVFSFYLIKRSTHPANFCMLFVLSFLLLLSFSRLFQTYYLAFISQILLLSAFIGNNDKKLTQL